MTVTAKAPAVRKTRTRKPKAAAAKTQKVAAPKAKKAAAPIEIIAEPGKAKATGKPDPREIAIKIINNAKNKSSIY